MPDVDLGTQTLVAEVGSRVQGYDLEGREELRLVVEEAQIAEVLGEVGTVLKRETALLVDQVEGRVIEVWSSETSLPGSLGAWYTRRR